MAVETWKWQFPNNNYRLHTTNYRLPTTDFKLQSSRPYGNLIAYLFMAFAEDRLSLTVERKTEIVGAYQAHQNDTGSPEVQIAILSEKI